MISIGRDLEGELYFLTLDGRLLGIDAAPCGPADLYQDEKLDFFDISEFLTAFNDHEPEGDINAESVFNFFDISAYIILYNQGCP